jgi:DNA polymerase I-like protein with 3'-5' exonuclease and polymerase domains
MLETFNGGGDIHKLTASFVLNKAISEVTKSDRQIAKAINFGLLFGMGAKKLVVYARNSYGVSMSEMDALAHREKFFELYSGLRSWHNRANMEIRGGANEVRTLSGRVRKFSRSQGDPKQIRFTAYLNTQVQGTGGDIIKLAMVLCDKAAMKYNASLVLQVHDELVFEVPLEHAEECRVKVKSTMEKAGRFFLPSVPVTVEANIGKTWDAAK